MAQECTIPCDARDLQWSQQLRLFGDEVYRRLPVLGASLVIVLVGIGLPVIAPIIAGVVLVLWGLLGALVVFAQAWLAAGVPARLSMPARVRALVDQHAASIHPARLPELRARAGELSLDEPNFDTFTTRFLQELREATGEAWRCRCPKRRLPLPI